MRRSVVNLLTMVSLIVCVSSLVLVARSLVHLDEVNVPIGQNSIVTAATIDGQLILWRTPHPGEFGYYRVPSPVARRWLDEVWQDITGIRWLGMGWRISDVGTWLILPLWLLPILTALPPLRWLWLCRRGVGLGFAVETRALTTKSTESTESTDRRAPSS